MFDKYKRYRERRKDHKVAVKIEFDFLLKELRGLPLVFSEAHISLARDQKTVKFPAAAVKDGKRIQAMPAKYRVGRTLYVPRWGSLQESRAGWTQ